MIMKVKLTEIIKSKMIMMKAKVQYPMHLMLKMNCIIKQRMY